MELKKLKIAIGIMAILCLLAFLCCLLPIGGCSALTKVVCEEEAKYWHYKSQIESIFHGAELIIPHLEAEYDIIKTLTPLPNLPHEDISKAEKILSAADIELTNLSNLLFKTVCHHPDDVDQAIEHLQQIKEHHETLKNLREKAEIHAE